MALIPRLGFSIRRFLVAWTPLTLMSSMSCPCCGSPFCFRGGLLAGAMMAVIALPFAYLRVVRTRLTPAIAKKEEPAES